MWHFMKKNLTADHERDMKDFYAPGLFSQLFRDSMLSQEPGDNVGLQLRRLKEFFFPIFPECYTLMHLAAFYGRGDLIKKLFGIEAFYAADLEGLTPLGYALSLRQFDCSDAIISYFIQNPDRLYLTYKDLLSLLETKSTTVKGLFKELMAVNKKTRHTEHRGKITGNPEIITLEGDVITNQEASPYFLDAVETKQREVEYLVTKFKFNSAPGSRESLELLETMENCEYEELWSSNLRYIVDEKWKRLRFYVQGVAIAHFLYLILISIYATAFLDNLAARGIALALACLFYSIEIVQMCINGFEYFKDIWNYFDMFGTLTFVVHSILMFTPTLGPQSNTMILAIAVFLQWFRAIGDMRAFEQTRLFVRLILQVVASMKSFVIFLILVSFMFAIVRYVLADPVTMPDHWILDEVLNGYRVILNKFDVGVTDPVLTWIFYLLNTVMIVIVLLPLLVSIMKDTFGMVMRTKVTQDYREKTSLCHEFENLMFWCRDNEARRYLHAIRYKGETVKQADPVRKNLDKMGEDLDKEIGDKHLKSLK